MEIKKILLLSSVYISEDTPKGVTPVVHYFAREWVKCGYEVKVVFISRNYPSFFYCLLKPFQKRLTSKVGFTVRTNPLIEKKYTLEGVDIYRIAIPRNILFRRHKKKHINVNLTKIIDWCEEISFTPDVIISHWTNPQLEIMYYLKQRFKVPTCYVAHDSSHFKVFGADAHMFWSAVDVVGFRSEQIKLQFESSDIFKKPSFFCYSGIPSLYCNGRVERNYESANNIVYVGTLIERKYPSVLVPAIHSVFGKTFNLIYAGEGEEEKSIIKIARKLGVRDNVRLVGRIGREDVIKLLDKSDLFIMISKKETFGLVYLEAMARGCITIASKKEGFDGIIRHGFNGFLCEAGNCRDLENVLSTIKNMTPQQRCVISNNAMNTANKMTDSKVAESYLTNIETLL